MLDKNPIVKSLRQSRSRDRMKSMDRVLALEAVLFWKGEPVLRASLAELLGISEGELQSAVEELRERLMGRGVWLLEAHDTLALVTAPEVSELIARITKEELSRDIGKAGLETLSVILYRGPLSKPEIDYIRGVNSQYILRIDAADVVYLGLAQ